MPEIATANRSPDSATRVLVADLRCEERRLFAVQPPGRFTLSTDSGEIPVLAVHDVSPSGIRLRVAGTPGVASRVVVGYHHGALDFQLNGITCWESPADDAPPAARLVGINLLAPTLLINIL